MKYNTLNVGVTPAKMQKLYPSIVKHKEGKNEYFYDFSLLESTPDAIKQDIIEKIIKQTSTTFGDATYSINSADEKYQYYIDADIQRYAVYNEKGKQIYRIMEITGLRITGYKWNIYDNIDFDQFPDFCSEYGKMRKSIYSPIIDIEF